jgi:L-lactate dehydrogenase complex protein LldE
MSVVKLLEQLGHEIIYDERITCCGQPAFNSGYWNETKPLARNVMEILGGDEPIVIPSGSCGAMLAKFYGELFKGEAEEDKAAAFGARVHEFSDFLVNVLGVTDVGARFEGEATFHDGCHGLRELGCKREPRELLARVAGLSLLEMDERETCCGFGGTFAAKFPMISTAMGEVKLESAARTGARWIISNDSSCLMHLQGMIDRQGLPLKTIHLAEVLASR